MKNNQKELVLLKDLGYLYPLETSKQKAKYGLYKCYCGNEFKARTNNVKRGITKSCGCLKNKGHKLSNHRLYSTWAAMINRCTNPNNIKYMNYGGRGIKVCDRWLYVKNFIDDMYPSYKDELTLDRISPYGNYEPSNCRWTTKTIQSRNTTKLRVDNKSGYRGVSYFTPTNRWVVKIMVNSKLIHLGYFIDKVEAAKAYDNYIIVNDLEHTKNLS